jgi:transcriptional regulator with XRE-family HTH domain
MTPEELRDWRKTLRLSQAKAAGILGCSRRTIQNYEAGARKIPRSIALAISAIQFKLPPYGTK